MIYRTIIHSIVCDSCRHWKMTSFMALDGVTSFLLLKDLFVFVALRPMSTAMVIAGRSVHLTTLFPGQA